MDYEGKSDKQSKCVLVMRTKKEKIWERMQYCRPGKLEITAGRALYVMV